MTVEPSRVTLRKYGLTIEEWREILERQGGVCPVCGKVPSTGRFHIDHEHIKNWKHLPAEKRKAAVRGLLCWYDNRWYLSRDMSVKKASNIQSYLLAYEQRKARY